MIARRTLVQASFAGGMIAALAGFAAFAAWFPKPDREEAETGWRRIGWPFPRDAFPAGRAWRRDGTEVYVRPKLGFCGNCATGVVEDSEVDRVSDVDLLDTHFVPAAEGKQIQITDLSGRARLYKIKKDGRERLAQGIAVSLNCDLIVAVAIGPLDDEAVAKSVRRFLETNTVQVWLNARLEGAQLEGK